MKYLLFCVIILTGCTFTVLKTAVKPTTASYDGNVLNSGLLGWSFNGSAIYTPTAKARYDFLLSKYGDQLVPPLNDNMEGIVKNAEGNYEMDKRHVIIFGTISRWKREGK